MLDRISEHDSWIDGLGDVRFDCNDFLAENLELFDNHSNRFDSPA